MRLESLILISVFALSGCIVRSYPVTRDRIDQDLSAGNRGYLMGKTPAAETTERKTTRTTRVVEVEFRPLIKFEGAPPQPSAVEATPAPTPIPEEQTEGQEEAVGNRGYIMQSETPEIAQPEMTQYKVEKGDTLQKIAKKFYGTSKKWMKIFEANKDRLSKPDKIYPGQVINIPAAKKSKPAAKKIPQNLK